MLLSDQKSKNAAPIAAELVDQVRIVTQSNWDRAGAVYEYKSLVTLESKSGFRFVEFRKLGDR